MASKDSEVDMRGAVGDLWANAPGGIACALQINIQPCLNGTDNNLVHSFLGTVYLLVAKGVRTRPGGK